MKARRRCYGARMTTRIGGAQEEEVDGKDEGMKKKRPVGTSAGNTNKGALIPRLSVPASCQVTSPDASAEEEFK